MSGRNYERLDILTFGRHLVTSGDLDPVYIALYRLLAVEGGWGLAQVQRWLVAYWCLYHCGAASFLSGKEGADFWEGLESAAVNDNPAPPGGRWPRGHERRHWRGRQAVLAWRLLKDTYPQPELMVQYIIGAGHKFEDVAGRAKEHRSFGPWISFKICDMVDRVLGHRVDFTQAAVFMWEDPKKSALMLWRQHMRLPEGAMPKDTQRAIDGVVEFLREKFAGYMAPPRQDRPIDLQEIETILCKWKSHMNGHYPLNNDIDEIMKGVVGWGKHADEFASAMPRAVR